ncbi:hypothetical protein QFZ63_002902 [Streptomyces sp. B3I7]|nr:hypothetical protein [Streptomyces sp. B3I7]
MCQILRGITGNTGQQGGARPRTGTAPTQVSKTSTHCRRPVLWSTAQPNSVAETAGGAARHTRARSVGAPAIVADCRRLGFERPRRGHPPSAEHRRTTGRLKPAPADGSDRSADGNNSGQPQPSTVARSSATGRTEGPTGPRPRLLSAWPHGVADQRGRRDTSPAFTSECVGLPFVRAAALGRRSRPSGRPQPGRHRDGKRPRTPSAGGTVTYGAGPTSRGSVLVPQPAGVLRGRVFRPPRSCAGCPPPLVPAFRCGSPPPP